MFIRQPGEFFGL